MPLRGTPRCPLGIGIDIVSLKRVRKFLSRQGTRITDRLLSSTEKKTFGKKKILNPEIFARIFSVKEAYFKSLDAPWLGLDGFSAIHVKFLPHNQFKVKSYASSVFGGHAAEGKFFSFKHLVGAQLVRWT